MFHRSAILACMASVFGAVSAGCDITHCEEGAICLDAQRDSATYQCAALCRHLVDCGRVERDQRGACIDACIEAFERDEDRLEDYCECSADSTCGELSRECGRPPFTLPPGEGEEPQREEDAGRPQADAGSHTDSGVDPGADTGTSADAQADAGASADTGAEPDAATQDASAEGGTDAGAAPDAAAGSCSQDDDCAASEGCLNGSCHARCEASCECRLGDVCEAGLCVTPPPASMSCETDCDCPAGNQCIASVCTPRETVLQ